MDIIKDEQEYRKERANPIDRLAEAHARDAIKGTKQDDPKKQKEFEETPEFETKLEKWHSNRDRYKSQGLPMTYILKMHNEYQEEVRVDRALFDAGKLPSQAGIKREPSTELEKSEEYLKQAQAKISELETELERSRS